MAGGELTVSGDREGRRRLRVEGQPIIEEHDGGGVVALVVRRDADPPQRLVLGIGRYRGPGTGTGRRDRLLHQDHLYAVFVTQPSEVVPGRGLLVHVPGGDGNRGHAGKVSAVRDQHQLGRSVAWPVV